MQKKWINAKQGKNPKCTPFSLPFSVLLFFHYQAETWQDIRSGWGRGSKCLCTNNTVSSLDWMSAGFMLKQSYVLFRNEEKQPLSGSWKLSELTVHKAVGNLTHVQRHNAGARVKIWLESCFLFWHRLHTIKLQFVLAKKKSIQCEHWIQEEDKNPLYCKSH